MLSNFRNLASEDKQIKCQMLYNYYSCHKDVAMLLILLRFYVNDIAYFFS
jgi:hypothetical protein